MTIAGDTLERCGMARLIRTRHALDVYLAQGPLVTLAMEALPAGRVRLVVRVVGHASIGLTDDALMTRATSHYYGALGLRPQEPVDPPAA